MVPVYSTNLTRLLYRPVRKLSVILRTLVVVLVGRVLQLASMLRHRLILDCTADFEDEKWMGQYMGVICSCQRALIFIRLL